VARCRSRKVARAPRPPASARVRQPPHAQGAQVLLELCPFFLQSVPEVDATLHQILQGQRYRPATQAGSPVPVDYTFKITFKAPQAG
jgi:hypothetical protein